MIIPALVYIAWDMYFTRLGVWHFNNEYVTGIYLYNLPLEEVLFFLIVPYCCVFIYACVRAYFPNLRDKRWAVWILAMLGVYMFVFGFICVSKYYTGWTFTLAGAFILSLFFLRRYFTGFDPASFLVSYAICLVPFLIVNGFLTSLPVVIYNDAENLGIRIHTIPVEDVVYGMLLILLNIVFYEKAKNR